MNSTPGYMYQPAMCVAVYPHIRNPHNQTIAYQGKKSYQKTHQFLASYK